MNKKIKGYISIALGILFCGSVVVGYMPIPEYAIELTCISNTCIGILLFVTGINLITKEKFFTSIIYHMWLVTILFVCVVSCVGHFNFNGAFFFLHLVNPLIFFAYYIFFIDDNKEKGKILLTPIPVIIYLAFDYIIGVLRGKFIYGLFEVNEMNLPVIVLIVCSAYIFLMVLAFITQYINESINVC